MEDPSQPSGTETSIANQKAFEPYLNAVKDSSQRARSILYVLVVALIALFAAYRNAVNPDWIDARYRVLQTAHSCLPLPPTPEGRRSTNCRDALKYAQHFVFQTGEEDIEKMDEDNRIDLKSDSGTDEWREFHQALDQVARTRTENLSIRMPILGLAMDGNDLGVIGGITFFALLYIFTLTLRRENDNFIRAKKKADVLDDPVNCELLLMSQLFSSPPGGARLWSRFRDRKRVDTNPGAKVGTTWWFYPLFFLPAVLDGWVVWSDFTSLKVADVLNPDARSDFGWELFFLILVIIGAALASRGWWNNERELKAIEDLRQSLPKRQPATGVELTSTT
jgi:hypothetical protein